MASENPYHYRKRPQWSWQEDELLLKYIDAHKVGGRYSGPRLTWDEKALRMNLDAKRLGIQQRQYTSGIIQSHYQDLLDLRDKDCVGSGLPGRIVPNDAQRQKLLPGRITEPPGGGPEPAAVNKGVYMPQSEAIGENTAFKDEMNVKYGFDIKGEVTFKNNF